MSARAAAGCDVQHRFRQINSEHSVGPGGEVLRVMPRTAAGVHHNRPRLEQIEEFLERSFRRMSKPLRGELLGDAIVRLNRPRLPIWRPEGYRS